MIALYFIIFGVVIRLAPHISFLNFLPHLPNFTPVAAIALFSAVYLKRNYAIGLPLLIMAVTDYFIGYYNGWIMFSVYSCFILIGLLGLYLRKHKNILNIAGITLAGSILFFLVTNFAMWAIPHSIYPHTWQGLIMCYTMGLPFFRNELAGDIFYVGVFFGAYELILSYLKRRQLCRVPSRN